MHLIDTHTHLFEEYFPDEMDMVVKRAESVGVRQMLVPNVDVNTIPQVLNTIASYPTALPMWGLHPCHVFGDWKEQWNIIQTTLEVCPPIAIGEIGLDFYWTKDWISEQKEALTFQLNIALDLNLPVSLHTREATFACIDLVKPMAKGGLRGVFHCFSGSEEEALEVIDMGFCLGLGGTLTFKNNNLRSWIKNIPNEFLVLETDAPYLAPVPYRGKRNEPSYIMEVALELARLKESDISEISRVTTRNAERVFGITEKSINP